MSLQTLDGVDVGSSGQSGAATQAFLLQGDEWVDPFGESVLLGSRLLGISFFHKMNSTVFAYANAADSSVIGRMLVKIGHDLSITPNGNTFHTLVRPRLNRLNPR